MATTPTRSSDRERTAARLLKSSAERSYDPDVDIDWDAPDDAELLFMPEELVTLYGTPLWETMTPKQRRDLGRYEIAWITSQGIQSEIVLMEILLRVAAKYDPTRAHVHYALTEVADECRHSTMFGRGLQTLRVEGDPPPPKLPPGAARVLRLIGAAVPIGPVSWAAALFIEDVLDKMQREIMTDERVQPRVRMVNRIHVLEEARHMTFAREELTRSMERSGSLTVAISRVVVGLAVYLNPVLQMHPRVYKNVGLDPYEARRQALANPHRKEAARRHAERFVSTMRDAGLIEGRLATALWKRSDFYSEAS